MGSSVPAARHRLGANDVERGVERDVEAARVAGECGVCGDELLDLGEEGVPRGRAADGSLRVAATSCCHG